jgi:hypothetical protein
MKTLHNPEQPRFTAAARSAAFLRGLAFGKPLLEVARSGLSHDLDEPSHIRYAQRIRKAGDSEMAFLALKSGVKSETAESILASAIDSPDTAFALLINGNASSEKAQAILASCLASPYYGLQCYMLLKLQTVPSPTAQEILAHAVQESGLSGRAAELLMQGSLASENAQKRISIIVPEDPKTIARILLSGKIAFEAAKELSKRMPPVCVPSE